MFDLEFMVLYNLKHERYCPFGFVMKEMERSYNEPDLHRVALNEK